MRCVLRRAGCCSCQQFQAPQLQVCLPRLEGSLRLTWRVCCAVLCCVVLCCRVEPDPSGSKDTCILVFSAGPPYEDIAFRIVNKEWETTQRYAFTWVVHLADSSCRNERSSLVLHCVRL